MCNAHWSCSGRADQGSFPLRRFESCAEAQQWGGSQHWVNRDFVIASPALHGCVVTAVGMQCTQASAQSSNVHACLGMPQSEMIDPANW